MAKAPIALFVYARPDHARRTVASLLRNHGASESDLFVFSDAARSPEKQAAVAEVRAFVASIDGFRSVQVVDRPVNFGLANSIIDGVGQVLATSERVIVVEDDMETSPHFLSYMNDALDLFDDDDRVISVHGYVYPVRRALPEAFFLRGADCWGWATWRRGWREFNPDGQALLDQLERQDLVNEFDYNGTYGFSRMLREQVAGRNDSWAIRWHAAAFLAGKLTLYPGCSLVHNIGNDSSGEHCAENDALDAGTLSAKPIDLRGVHVGADAQARAAFEEFFRSLQPSLVHRVAQRARAAFRALAG